MPHMALPQPHQPWTQPTVNSTLSFTLCTVIISGVGLKLKDACKAERAVDCSMKRKLGRVAARIRAATSANLLYIHFGGATVCTVGAG